MGHRLCQVGRGLGGKETALEQMGLAAPHSGCCSPAWDLDLSFLPVNGGDKPTSEGRAEDEMKQVLRCPTQCLAHSRCLKQVPSPVFTSGL